MCSSFFPHVVGVEKYTVKKKKLGFSPKHIILGQELKSNKYHVVCNKTMGTNNMERREQQAASQAKMSSKGENLSPLQYVTRSQKKGKVKSYACHSQRKFCKTRRKISAFITVCSYRLAQILTPVLCHELFPPWPQQQKTGQTLSPPCWSYWSTDSCPMVCCTCLSL